MKPYLKNKISILKLSAYSKVADKALIAEKDNKELQQYKERQRKRNRSDNALGVHAQKRLVSTNYQNEQKRMQNLNVICTICGKKH